MSKQLKQIIQRKTKLELKLAALLKIPENIIIELFCRGDNEFTLIIESLDVNTINKTLELLEQLKLCNVSSFETCVETEATYIYFETI